MRFKSPLLASARLSAGTRLRRHLQRPAVWRASVGLSSRTSVPRSVDCLTSYRSGVHAEAHSPEEQPLEHSRNAASRAGGGPPRPSSTQGLFERCTGPLAMESHSIRNYLSRNMKSRRLTQDHHGNNHGSPRPSGASLPEPHHTAGGDGREFRSSHHSR